MSALVLGHMNPDTDSIIAAIAIADLYKKRGLDVKAAAQIGRASCRERV